MPRVEVNIMIKNGDVLTMNPLRTIIKNGTIVVKDGLIVDIGEDKEIRGRYNAEEKIDATGKVIMPGLINTHTHVSDILLRGGLSQGRTLYEWLGNVLYPGLTNYTLDDVRLASTLYCIESIRSGITTFVDNADSGIFDHFAEMTLEVYREMGVRAIYARMFVDKLPKHLVKYLDYIESKEPYVKHGKVNFIENTQEALNKIKELMKKYHASAEGRISIWPAPGVPNFLTVEGLQDSLKLAYEFDCMTTTHISESRYDSTISKVSTVQYLDAIGYINERLLAGHCVWVDQKDMRIIKNRGAKVAHNPVSNQYLASGIAPVAIMLDLGIIVGLGTDDANCNDSINMLSDMKHAVLIQKIHEHDAEVMPAGKALEMSTIDGAKAIGMDNDIGSLEVGKKADIIIINMQKPHLKPCHCIPSVLVFQANGSEIETTIINGKVIMRDSVLTCFSELEEVMIMDRAQQASMEIAERAGIKNKN